MRNMSQDNQNEQLSKIGNWVLSRLDKYESMIVLVFLVGFVLKVMTDLKVGILIVISLTTLAILYFLKGFSATGDENAGGLEIFVDKLVSFGGSVATIGILFRIEYWPGYHMMILSGCMTLAISLPIILVLKSKNLI